MDGKMKMNFFLFFTEILLHEEIDRVVKENVNDEHHHLLHRHNDVNVAHKRHHLHRHRRHRIDRKNGKMMNLLNIIITLSLRMHSESETFPSTSEQKSSTPSPSDDERAPEEDQQSNSRR